MPIFVYENEGEEEVTFILSPNEEEFRIAPLASAIAPFSRWEDI